MLLPALAIAQTPALQLSALPGSTEVIESAVTIDSPASGATEWFVKSDQRWVTVEPRTGITPTRVVIRVNPSGLTQGEQRAILRFVDDAGEEMLVVPITLNVGLVEPAPVEPAKTTSTPARARPAAAADAPTSSKATLTAPAATPLTITIDMLPIVSRNMPYSQAIPVRGGTPPYAVRVVNSRLPMGIAMVNGALTGATRFPGTYPLNIVVVDSSTPPQTVSKTLELRVIVIYQGTALSVSSASLTLSGTAGQRFQGARVGVASGAQPLAWTVSADQSWMLVSPGRGMAPGLFQVDVVARELDPGTHVGMLTVTMDGAPNSPMRIPVQVTIRK